MAQTYAQPQQKQAQETARAAVPQPLAAPAARAGFALPQCAVTPGAEQGGIVDWFRARFPRREQEEVEVPAEVHPPAEPTQQWVEDSYGPVDFSQVTQLPAPDSPLFEKVKPYALEGPAQAPVFETHSFMPRKSLDGVSATNLHSFIGLRFTQLDPKSNRAVRKQIKVGFGSNGGAFTAHGAMTTDTDTQADMSTETPISRAKLEYAFTEIPRKMERPYNVISHNCNHFTKEMAELMGATLPAQLHDAVLGPAQAYKNLARAAEDGPQGRTRFFQGGSMDSGQMSKRRPLLNEFWGTAKQAARRDGLPFLLYPELSQAALRVQLAARKLTPLYRPDPILDPTEQANFARRADDLIQEAEALVQLRLWKRHPRLTIAAKKTVALVHLMQSHSIPERRTMAQYSPQEIDAMLTQDTQAEQDAPMMYEQGKEIFKHNPARLATLRLQVDNSLLFTDNRTRFEGAGEIFLDAMGLPAAPLVQQHTPEWGGSGLAECSQLLDQVLAGLRAPTEELDNYLLTFLQCRALMSPAQLGALASGGIVNYLSTISASLRNPLANVLDDLSSTGRLIASRREADSLKQDASAATWEPAQSFIDLDTEEADQLRRRELLTQMKDMETLLAQRCETLRAQMLGQAVPAPEGEE